MALSASRIELEIGELVLRGVDPAHRHAVADALRAELERLLAHPGSAARIRGGTAIDRIGAGSVRVGAGTRPEVLGARLARAVFSALAPPAPTEPGTGGER